MGPTAWEAVALARLEAPRDEVAESERRVTGLLWAVAAWKD